MKTLKLTLAVTLATVMFNGFVSQVVAQADLEQEQNQELEVVCETGDYGQNVNCRATGTQEQSQRATLDGEPVVFKDGKLVKLHEVVDTGLDTNSLVVAFGTMVSGAAATVIKIKNKA